jgi:hypothetical protein
VVVACAVAAGDDEVGVFVDGVGVDGVGVDEVGFDEVAVDEAGAELVWLFKVPLLTTTTTTRPITSSETARPIAIFFTGPPLPSVSYVPTRGRNDI